MKRCNGAPSRGDYRHALIAWLPVNLPSCHQGLGDARRPSFRGPAEAVCDAAHLGVPPTRGAIAPLLINTRCHIGAEGDAHLTSLHSPVKRCCSQAPLRSVPQARSAVAAASQHRSAIGAEERQLVTGPKWQWLGVRRKPRGSMGDNGGDMGQRGGAIAAVVPADSAIQQRRIPARNNARLVGTGENGAASRLIQVRCTISRNRSVGGVQNLAWRAVLLSEVAASQSRAQLSPQQIDAPG